MPNRGKYLIIPTHQPTHLRLDLHLLDDRDFGDKFPGLLDLADIVIDLFRQATLRCRESSRRSQTQEVLVSVDDLALAVFDPLEIWRHIGDIGERVVIIRDHPVRLLVDSLCKSLRWVGGSFVGCRRRPISLVSRSCTPRLCFSLMLQEPAHGCLGP